MKKKEITSCFWVFRGMLSSSTSVIYSSNKKPPTDTHFDSKINWIKKLSDDWYYVNAE